MIGASVLSGLAEQGSDGLAYALIAVLFAITAATFLRRPRALNLVPR